MKNKELELDLAAKARRREWASKGGKRTAALGKSGFKTMTREQRSEAGKRGHKAMLRKLTQQVDHADDAL